jgi:hypothetical protein
MRFYGTDLNALMFELYEHILNFDVENLARKENKICRFK